MQLTYNNLPSLASNIAVPSYDRSAVSGGILHIGVGNFHRAHQAVYLNDLLAQGGDPAWGLTGAGVFAPDAAMREKLKKQDFLYSVTEIDGTSAKASVIGAMTGFVAVEPKSNRALIAAMTDPAVRIVSLTITEGGYFLDAAGGGFNISHPDIIADINTPGSGHTVIGAIISALTHRRDAKIPPFTVLSCDNIPGNGDITRRAVLSLAAAISADLSRWIEDNVTFPNTMVDRITPATGERERAFIQETFRLDDTAPVTCEPFRQWVLEDNFCNGRPHLEAAGAEFTDNIHAYEAMKIRILNGGHAILAYPAALLGYSYVHDAMNAPIISAFLTKVLREDVLPYVKPVPGYTPESYLELILRRFANPGVADTTQRLCYDGANRQPKFIVPVITDNITAGRVPRGLALCCALWSHYCAGIDAAGNIIPANDPQWNTLQQTARRAAESPSVWLEQAAIYGDISLHEGFSLAFSDALHKINTKGPEAATAFYLNT